MELEVDLGYRTDVGRRREHNEDCLAVYPRDKQFKNQEEAARRGMMLIVADGMGGYAAGEIASRTAVEAVVDAYYGDLSRDLEDSIADALHKANSAVLDEASRDSERAGMGTTMALAVLREAELAVANVGDARVYHIRGDAIVQLSQDHSWVAELVAGGKITAEEARRHPMRNVVTRSLGGRPQVEVDVYPRQRLKTGDVIVVCSDGLWGMIGTERILGLVESHPDPQEAADALIQAANDAGGHDNISVIVCLVRSAPEAEGANQDALARQDTDPLPDLSS